MVFFTCSHCGEPVKKPSVAKHFQTKCRKKEPFLTCVDCLKDFKGNEYEAHTKCLTEEEKYSAKGYVPKPSQNKGEKKQQAWQECIQTVLKKPTLKPDEKDLIRAISKYENVPRKKAKFINFLTNAFRQYANKNDLIDRVWSEMESVFKEMSANSNEEQNQNQKDVKQLQQEQQKPQKQDSQNASKKLSPKVEENAVKKEKKRKRQAEEEKPADASESGKADEKLKKKKQKSNEENTVEGNSDMLITDETENKQEKKNRKRKADDNSQTEQNNSVADEAEPGKKKKKKKNEKPAENQINETPAQNPETESKNKKKNKKPKSENAGAKTAAEVAAPAGAGDANAVKKEKKGKKSENKENCGGKPVVQSTKGDVQEEVDKVAPKKKKAAGAAASKGETVGDENKQETFDWKATILQVLNQDGKNNKIQLQKLQKKVLKLHCQILNCENSEKKEKKFLKKLKEIPQIEIDKDFVVLKS